MNKQELINYMVDVLGYSYEELLRYDQKELFEMLSDVQIQEALKYSGVTV